MKGEYYEKYKSMECKDEAGPAGTGGTGVDRCAGECESGDGCVRLQVGLPEAPVRKEIPG